MTSTSGCWCATMPNVGPVAASGQDCLCPACLSEAIAELSVEGNPASDMKSHKSAAPAPLIENEDYYLEGPAMVFTAQFLLRRGYCCESGCRHCPY